MRHSEGGKGRRRPAPQPANRAQRLRVLKPQRMLNSVEQFRELVENANDAIALVTDEGILAYINRGAERMLGWTRKEVCGHHIEKVVTPATAQRIIERNAQFTAGERLSSLFEADLVHKDGSIIPVEARVRVVRDETGAVIGYQGVYRDVRERKRAEQRLQASEERWRLVGESLSEYAFSFRIDGRGDLYIEWVTESFTRLTGYSDIELIGISNPLRYYMHEDDVERVMTTIRSLTPGPVSTYDFRIRNKNTKEERWMRSRAQVVAEDGKIVRLYGAAHDITDERAAIQQMEQQRVDYERILESAPDVIFTLDMNGRLSSLNRAFVTQTGWMEADWKGNKFVDVIDHGDRERAQGLLDKLFAGMEAGDFTMRVRTKDGGRRIAEFRAVQLRKDDVIERIVGIMRDVTEREEAKAKLEQNRQLLTRITDTIPEIMYLYDLQQHAITYVNSRVTTSLGYPPDNWIGRSIEAVEPLLHEEDRVLLAKYEERCARLGDEDFLEREVRVKHINGSYRWMALREFVCMRAPDGTAVSILGIGQDIHARKQLLDQAKARKINPVQVGKRLREFREELTLTQAEFGAQFGGYDNQQIGTYERGLVDIPFKLLLSVYTQGYPLEKVIGAGSTHLLDETLSYLPDNHRDQRIVAQLIETLHAYYQRDRQKMDRVMGELGIAEKHLSANQSAVLKLLEEIKKQMV